MWELAAYTAGRKENEEFLSLLPKIDDGQMASCLQQKSLDEEYNNNEKGIYRESLHILKLLLTEACLQKSFIVVHHISVESLEE